MYRACREFITGINDAPRHMVPDECSQLHPTKASMHVNIHSEVAEGSVKCSRGARYLSLQSLSRTDSYSVRWSLVKFGLCLQVLQMVRRYNYKRSESPC
jgi:hypothetical protein